MAKIAWHILGNSRGYLKSREEMRLRRKKFQEHWQAVDEPIAEFDTLGE